MRKIALWTYVLVSILLVAPLVAVLIAAARGLGTPFPAFDLFDLSARVLPGSVITFGIDTIVGIVRGLNLGPTDTTAKLAERLMATGIFSVTLIIASLAYFAVARRALANSRRLERDSLLSGLAFGLILGLPLVAVSLAFNHDATAPQAVTAVWLLLAYVAWGLAHGFVYSRLVALPASTTVTSNSLDRRQFLIRFGGTVAAITVFGAGLSTLLGSDVPTEAVLPDATDTPKNPAALPNASDSLVPAPGTRPEYTPVDRHYRIDINTGSGPRVDLSTYKLKINGLVDNPVDLSLDDIRKKYPPMEQYITMSCISNPLAGDLISTTKWTGTSMQHILDLVRPTDKATHIRITAADGFDEVVALDTIRQDERVMLTYDWDDKPLTQQHGSPLRIHVPNHYGMKQPKWITGMEFIDSWQEGYWVRRGWDKDAFVRATSVIDTVAINSKFTDDKGQTLVPIGGIAWAGTRGISRVEVKVDDGEWTPAQLRQPISDKTWTIWRYDWPFTAGDHTFAVRCFEGDGTAQIDRYADVRPSGATGIHTIHAKA
jgi:DMSO/TMAO reductase YedYZ molybdopterin-dependent catalytic subunit